MLSAFGSRSLLCMSSRSQYTSIEHILIPIILSQSEIGPALSVLADLP